MLSNDKKSSIVIFFAVRTLVSSRTNSTAVTHELIKAVWAARYISNKRTKRQGRSNRYLLFSEDFAAKLIVAMIPIPEMPPRIDASVSCVGEINLE